MKTISILSLTIGAALATAAPATAATISPTGVRFPAAAVNDDGATLVAWERLVKGTFVVEARSGASAGRLGRTTRLADPGFGPQVAIGDDGTKAVMWMQRGARRNQSIRVAVARPGRRFAGARVVEQRKAILAPVGVRVQPGGRVVAIWQRSGSLVRYALAAPGRRFGSPRTLTRIGVAGSIAVDGRDGTVVVAVNPPAPSTALGAVRTLAPSQRDFSAPQDVLAGAAGVTGVLPVAVSGPGGAAIAYTRVGDRSALALVRRNADGTFAAAQQIALARSAENVFATNLTATLPTDGSAVAAWSIQAESPGEGGAIVSRTSAAAIAPPAAPFGMAQLLSPGPPRTFSAPSAAAAGAEAFVATAEPQGPVLLATRAAGATAFTTTTLAARGNGDVMLAAAGSHVIATYQRNDRLRLKVVR